MKSLRRAFHVKAVTRDPNKAEAKALHNLGVEVVAADLLQPMMAGAPAGFVKMNDELKAYAESAAGAR